MVLDASYLQFFGDDFLRLLLLRYVFCDVVLHLHRAFRGRQFRPRCQPPLPDAELLEHVSLQHLVLDLAAHLEVRSHFMESHEVEWSRSSSFLTDTRRYDQYRSGREEEARGTINTVIRTIILLVFALVLLFNSRMLWFTLVEAVHFFWTFHASTSRLICTLMTTAIGLSGCKFIWPMMYRDSISKQLLLGRVILT